MVVLRMTLEQSDDGRSIELPVGATLELRLPENPSTGYRWTVDQVDSTVLRVNEPRFVADGGAVGRGGARVFSFSATKPGHSPLSLKLWREWEGDSSVTSRFGVTLTVVSQ
jgi:inhibitor of cysteine peptidase